MFGAILGDIIGSPYEFDQGDKTKDFPLFSADSTFTDDTVMTIAVADALMSFGPDDDFNEVLISTMRRYGRRYPDVGYGDNFYHWLFSHNTKPYGSYGNGSAMRVSSVAWLYDDPISVVYMAKKTAAITHNHPEGIKGAEATAYAIYLARSHKYSKEMIKNTIERMYGYDLSRSCDEIRATYFHDESCMKTVPEAIICFLESENFEDAIRNAVSLGGDTDTLAAITGSIAEGYYGIPEELKQKCYSRLPDDLADILRIFENKIKEKFK